MNSSKKIFQKSLLSDNKPTQEIVDNINKKIAEQDKQLDTILAGLETLKKIAADINSELIAQKKILDKLNLHIDRTDNSIKKATRETMRLKK